MFKLPAEIKNDINGYKDKLSRFLSGELSAAYFKGVRVPWGVYSQRKEVGYMVRVRFPGGDVNPEQLKAIARMSKEYGNGILRVTTRQDIQIHSVMNIADTSAIFDYLERFELSSRGGGGNTVRNITACPLAGLCCRQVFDVRPFAVGLSEYILKDRDSFSLPRKYKIAFSACSEDCALATATDLGFIAKKGSGGKGLAFTVYAGGGLGAHSAIGQLLETFVDPSEIGYIAEAVKRVFNQYGERRDRHRARLRFLVEKIGFAKFKELYKEALEKLKKEKHIALRKIEFPQPAPCGEKIQESKDKEFDLWKKYNLKEQLQKGNFTIEIRLNLGDIRADELNAIADLCVGFKGLEIRSSQNQNLLLCNVCAEDVYPLFKRLKSLNLARPNASTVTDVICCAGATTCNLGLCNSKGAAREIIKILEGSSLDLNILRDVQIKVSGCPNSCAQHPVAPLGIHGLSRKVGTRSVPFYRILAGGSVREGESRLARDMGIVPARNIPSLIKDFLVEAGKDLKKYIDFYDYLMKEGEALLKKLVDKYSYVPPYDEDPSFYKDWGREEDFSLAGIGPGECGAGALDMIEADIKDATDALEKVRSLSEPRAMLKKALYLGSRAFLVVRGLEPKTEKEAVTMFLNEFVEKGIFAKEFSGIVQAFEKLDNSEQAYEKKEMIDYAAKFLKEVSSIYKSMDSNFNFKVKETPSDIPAEEAKKKPSSKVLDLKGVACPMNYVKAKLCLESMEKGEVVEILLDGGPPIENVPPSLRNDGQKIVEIKKKDDIFSLKVEKVV